MIKWLARVAACVVFMAVCNVASGEDITIDLKGTWSGRIIRHATQQGFVPYYSSMRLVMEEQNGTQFKGHLVNDLGRDETRVKFSGAIDLENEYLYFKLASGDVYIGQITTGNRLILFVADSDKDIVTVFKLRKTESP